MMEIEVGKYYEHKHAGTVECVETIDDRHFLAKPLIGRGSREDGTTLIAICNITKEIKR